MTRTPVSIVIVSRHRPDALALCLTGLGQLLYPDYEIVVVADPAAIACLGAWQGRAKLLPFDEANISAARNLGLAHAAGKIVAFIDDDAVAEPAWLDHLAAPFRDPDVMAAGGYVRGRNGISFQWQGRMVDHLAQTTPLPAQNAPVIVTQQAGHALKTEGTNMAFRRSALADLGGFDPALPFYLDETDVNLRLAATGAKAALVPLAQVHHGFAASIRRHDNRVPKTLRDVGASLAVFLRKHAPPEAARPRFDAECAERRAGLQAHLQAKRLDKAQMQQLLDSLHAGWDEGQRRPLAPLPRISAPESAFLPYRKVMPARGHRVISGFFPRRRSLAAKARNAVQQGHIVSVFLLSPTALFHHIRFHPDGYWLQTGGIFGKSQRNDPLFRIWRSKDRIARELSLVTSARLFNEHPFYSDN